MQTTIHTLEDRYDSNGDFSITLREYEAMDIHVCMYSLDYMVRSGHVIGSSSTYVGMITARRARQKTKALSDMVTREVGRDRKVRASLARRESYKRSRRRREVDNLV